MMGAFSGCAQSSVTDHLWLPAPKPGWHLLAIEADSTFDAEAGNEASRRQPVYVLGSHLKRLGQFVHLQRGGPLLDLFQYGHEFLFAMDSSGHPFDCAGIRQLPQRMQGADRFRAPLFRLCPVQNHLRSIASFGQMSAASSPKICRKTGALYC